MHPFQDPSLSPEARVEDLLARMTLSEKIAQLSGYMFFDNFWESNADRSEQERIDYIQSVMPADMIPPEGMGFIASQLRDLPPRIAVEIANRTQAYNREHTRFGIPIIIHDEGVHGLIGNGATVFPSAIGMAATWNPELIEQVAHVIGCEAKVRGVSQILSPTLNLARDPRNGRIEETYGEDPLLASLFATAFVRGVQSEGVICTPKHFIVNFEGDGGRDSEAAEISERALRELYLPPFEHCIRNATPWSLMASYNSLNGRPCSADHRLLTDLLRNELGFDGYVVSDYHSVIHQYELHGTAADMGDAAQQALEAGLEVELPRTRTFGEPLLERLADGKLSENVIHEACRRVLKPRFAMGFFEDTPRDAGEAERVTNQASHRELALNVARESVVLLHNEDNLLPIASRFKRILVIGPNANAIELGDYSWDLNSKQNVATLYEGLRAAAPEGVEIRLGQSDFPRGAANVTTLEGEVEWADLVIFAGGLSHSITREAIDRRAIEMPIEQSSLYCWAWHSRGNAPFICVLFGTVSILPEYERHPDALLQTWYPGEEGGTALAEILFGATQPSGRLPLTIPKGTGWLPLCYNHRPSGRGFRYAEGVEYPFGYGLTFTTFEYSDLSVSVSQSGDVTAEFRITNTGNVPGTEVPQLYIHDVLASVTRPHKELKAFTRVTLRPGESQRMRLTVTTADLMLWNIDMQHVFEPGEFDILIGANSEDIRITQRITVA